jgi:hypothetical protein
MLSAHQASPPSGRTTKRLTTRSRRYAFTSSPECRNSSATRMTSSMIDDISSSVKRTGPPPGAPPPGAEFVSSAGHAKTLHVFDAKCPNSRGELNGSKTPAAHSCDERTRIQAGLTKGVCG